jgi:hypothetical protein
MQIMERMREERQRIERMNNRERRERTRPQGGQRAETASRPETL